MNAHVLGIITIMVLLPRFMSYCNRNAYKYKSKLSKQQFILYHSSIESTKLNEPIDFNSNFQLPITGEIFPLQYQNSHPLDKSLTFDEITHKYTYSNIVIKKSVTQLISNYFDKFIPEVEAVKMVKSKNWPRPQYLLPNNVPFSVDEILQCWSQNGEYARNRGTWMHYNIERFLNGLEPIGDLPEFQLFLKCYNDYIIQQNITPYRTEWRIVAPDIQLAGSVDFVGKKEDGSLVIMDWKRSKNLQDKLVNNYGKKAKNPIKHLDDCDGIKYSLQLNLYKYILEKYYDVQISTLLLTSFYPNCDDYFVVEVDDYQEEIRNILSDYSVLFSN